MMQRAIALTASNSDFPPSLGQAGFGTLWAIGKVERLRGRWLGFFCSKKSPGAPIVAIYDVARALRDAKIPVVSGFHSPMEKECLGLLIRGTQPIAYCPARGIQTMRIRAEWKEPIADGRLIVVSPFEAEKRRMTSELAERRNHFVASLASEIFIGHAEPESKTEAFALSLLQAGKSVLLLDASRNKILEEHGAIVLYTNQLVSRLTQRWDDSHFTRPMVSE